VNRPSQRFSPSRVSQWLIPLILAFLSLLLIVTVAAIVLSLLGLLT
jgi:hypothetical protein